MVGFTLTKDTTHDDLVKHLRQDNLSYFEEAKVEAYLVKQHFKQDFVKRFPTPQAEALAKHRAKVYMWLFSRKYEAYRISALAQASIEKAALLNIIYHRCPLGMETWQMLGMFRGLARCIPAKFGAFKIILTGSSTTFFSENPDKPGHFFDKNRLVPDAKGKQDLGDYDLAIAFADRSHFIAHAGEPPDTPYGPAWLPSKSVKVLDLVEFYRVWGNHPFDKKLGGTISQKHFNRDIGIVILGYSWTEAGTACNFWKKDFVYDSIQDKVLTPKYGILKPRHGKGKGQCKGKGKAKGVKGKGKGLTGRGLKKFVTKQMQQPM